MFSDLVALFDGWYLSFVSSIRSTLQSVDPDTGVVTDPEIWSAYVPWEQLIAAVVLCIFIVCVFRFLRSVLCKML